MKAYRYLVDEKNASDKAEALSKFLQLVSPYITFLQNPILIFFLTETHKYYWLNLFL